MDDESSRARGQKRPLSSSSQDSSLLSAVELDTLDSDKLHKDLDNKVLQDEELMVDLTESKISISMLLCAITRKSNGIIDPKYEGYSAAKEALREIPNLNEKLKEACDTKSFKSIRLFPALRNPSFGAKVKRFTPHKPSYEYVFVQYAWQTPYSGKADRVLFDSICKMKSDNNHKAYHNIVAVLQSSGYGKSRMLDAQSRFVFTFPINMRNPQETVDGNAYPVPDNELRSFMQKEENSELDIAAKYACFFRALFLTASDKLQTRMKENKQKFKNSEEAASWWRNELIGDVQRRTFYTDVIQKASQYKGSNTAAILPSPPQNCNIGRKFSDESKMARQALEEFVRSLQNSVDKVDNSSVKVVIYFDEAHELAVKFDANSNRYLTDVLFTTMDAFVTQPLMAVFISTTSRLAELAAPRFQARSARVFNNKISEQAPITELPFDCHPLFPLDPAVYSLHDISQLEFLAKFGRPLFWTLIDGGMSSESVLQLAISKLSPPQKEAIQDGQMAVIDLLMMLEYEPDMRDAQELQERLVASHMRTAISIPSHRQFIRSCYSSEPFLAEAASQLLAEWQRLDSNFLIKTVNHHYHCGLLHTGDVSELAVRILLTSAYQQACQTDRPVSAYNRYSQGCKVRTFLCSLFAQGETACAAKPDNVVHDPKDTNKIPTLDEALGDAVIRFTHFGKFSDDTATSYMGAHAALLRGMAIICRNGQECVDMILPVLVRVEGKACKHAVTAIFIQVKRRLRRGSARKLTIDESNIKFFPRVCKRCECCEGPLTGDLDALNLPYISLVLDLGIQKSVPSYLHIPIKFNPQTVKPSKFISSAPSPWEFSVLKPPMRHSLRQPVEPSHPRYSIYCGGCSPELYCDITPVNQNEYMRLLRLGHLLGDHPRQDADQLSMIMDLKPTWAGGHSFNWLTEQSLQWPNGESEEDDTEASGTSEIVAEEYPCGEQNDSMQVESD